MTEQPRKRITIETPDGSTILAARHLDATEGRVQIGSTVDTATRSAITRVLGYIAKAHNSPAAPALEEQLDGAYRERAHLVALLAAHYPSVIAPALDLDEAGWWIVYLRLDGRQASWHISPRDAGLFAHVERVAPDDRRAQWDGHTTEQKYQHIGALSARLYGEARGLVETPLTPSGEAVRQMNADPGQPHTGLVVQPYTENGEQKWVFRCWGTDDGCDGWLSLDHYSEQSAIRARDRHVTEEHPNEEQLPTAADRVRTLHKRNENTGECEYCSFRDYPTYAVPFPCDTVRALDGQEQPSV